MSMFDFLNNIQLPEESKATKKSSGGPKKERNPTNADLRLFSTGAIYPSAELVTKWDLEYKNKSAAETDPGNGLDIFRSTSWPLTAAMPKAFLIVGPVSRNEAKLDVFFKATYDGDVPTASVLEQGATTFGKTLLKWLYEVYGVTPNKEGYIDLVVVFQHRLKTPNDVYNVPKTIVRGDRAGEETYERRENIFYFPLAVAEGHVSDTTISSTQEEPAATPAPKEEPIQEEASQPLQAAETTTDESPLSSTADSPTLNDLFGSEEETEASVEEEDADIEDARTEEELGDSADLL